MNNSENDKLSKDIEEDDVNVKSESPINLTISKMTIINLEPLIWHNYDKSPEKLKAMNTGRTIIVNGKWQENHHPLLTGGPLSNNYIFSQFHFHWGPNEMVGSEHYVDSASCSHKQMKY
ncbi:putative carbonic anhydrase 5 [Chelonus insularis]|uniref:putative carbonic anhydrase 5 n=1 Tax=Chelonus insularis TaxID=460826 RepID=UPI00158AB30F|nr:putative carbonic anhydrase 5 [Chelonus insularis]